MELSSNNIITLLPELWSIILKDTKLRDLVNTSLVCKQFNNILTAKRNSLRKLHLHKFVKPFYPKHVLEQLRNEETFKYSAEQRIEVWYKGKNIGYVIRTYFNLKFYWVRFLYFKDTLWKEMNCTDYYTTITKHSSDIQKYKVKLPQYPSINKKTSIGWFDEATGNDSYTNFEKATSEIEFMYFVATTYYEQ